MVDNIRLFALYEGNNPHVYKGKREISSNCASEINKKGYGIFFTPNTCIGKLTEENVTKINCWFVDIDEGEKKDILNKIKNAPLIPSMIIETKRGYHAYWKAKNGTKENFRIIEQGLINYFGGDNAVKNPNRLMRVPFFYHMKDESNPFLIKIVESNTNEYSEELMKMAFIPIKIIKKQKQYKQDEEVKIDKFKNEYTLIKYFCSKLKGDLSCFNADSGRRNYLLKMIGRLKRHFNYSFSERAYIIKTINNHFACPLDNDEVETVLNTTIKDKNV